MYEVKRRNTMHGICPPGYEKVKAYRRKDGEEVSEHCRKIKVKGRMKTLESGLYNEGMIAQEDIRLSYDTIVDSTTKGEKNAKTIQRRAQKIQEIMSEQERKKQVVREKEG